MQTDHVIITQMCNIYLIFC